MQHQHITVLACFSTSIFQHFYSIMTAHVLSMEVKKVLVCSSHFFVASKHWRLTDWLFWNLLKHLGMISISFGMFGTCLFFYIYYLKIINFFCLYFVKSTFVYNVKFSYWSMTVQLYKTKIKKIKQTVITWQKMIMHGHGASQESFSK